MIDNVSRELKVLFVTGSFPPMKCGIGDYAQLLAAALLQNNVLKISVLTGRDCTRSADGSRLKIFPIMNKWRLREVGRVIGVLRHEKPDLVHIQYPTQGYKKALLPMLLPIIFRIAGLHLVQTWHEIYERVGPRTALQLTFAGLAAGGVVSVRPNYVEATAQRWRWIFRNKLLRFIPNASSIPAIVLDEASRSKIRRQYADADSRCVVYFGFIHAAKGTHLLFDVADPRRDWIIIVGEGEKADPYYQSVLMTAAGDRWKNRVTLTGFLPIDEVARVLAAADAVVLPFQKGGGAWNTSIHGAQLQGTFLLTTSLNPVGYDKAANTFYAPVGDIKMMQDALSKYAGRVIPSPDRATHFSWPHIADAHVKLYRDVIARR